MLYNFKGKITDKESTLVSAPKDKKYLIKSLIILNNSGVSGIMFDLYIRYGIKLSQYISPKNLVLNDKETFVMDYGLVLESGDSLRSILTIPQIFTTANSFLDFNITVEEV